jgi:hypothetical protein
MKFIKIIGLFRNSVPLSKYEKRVSIKMITWLILFREKWTFTLIIKSNPEGATLCGEKTHLLNFKASGAYSYHFYFKL